MTARMQYTATSFAEPLQRVFDDVLAPETDIDVTPHAESAYLVERVQFHARVPDRIEHRLYRPLLAAARAVGDGRPRAWPTAACTATSATGSSPSPACCIVLAVTR